VSRREAATDHLRAQHDGRPRDVLTLFWDLLGDPRSRQRRTSWFARLEASRRDLIAAGEGPGQRQKDLALNLGPAWAAVADLVLGSLLRASPREPFS